MDSLPIAQFPESTYPDPPVPLTSELSREIETKARSVLGKAIYSSAMPHKIRILSPRSQEYFRCMRQDQVWNDVSDVMGVVGELVRTHKAEGPFALSSRPSHTDFFISGSLHSTRVADEGVFQMMIR
ncbi:hypothetical protein N7471_009526 [Penicillium samsonianum]|uniref:uncharacterized protein n=1 Tax=Penicillium samsonianum TaxID=1882272 RepID=UPI00254939E4|nr:uncharacterized protein N7471_009526 [Penicillium samsonianum]KAJ6128309.1 hypothetical protein N7471_009526 [Penicillium samsonianum]